MISYGFIFRLSIAAEGQDADFVRLPKIRGSHICQTSFAVGCKFTTSFQMILSGLRFSTVGPKKHLERDRMPTTEGNLLSGTGRHATFV